MRASDVIGDAILDRSISLTIDPLETSYAITIDATYHYVAMRQMLAFLKSYMLPKGDPIDLSGDLIRQRFRQQIAALGQDDLLDQIPDDLFRSFARMINERRDKVLKRRQDLTYGTMKPETMVKRLRPYYEMAFIYWAEDLEERFCTQRLETMPRLKERCIVVSEGDHLRRIEPFNGAFVFAGIPDAVRLKTLLDAIISVHQRQPLIDDDQFAPVTVSLPVSRIELTE